MSPSEVWHRAEEMRKKRAGRAIKGWDALLVADGPLPLFPLPPKSELELSPNLLKDFEESFYVSKHSAWSLLGRSWPGGNDPNIWNLDPATGGHWPSEDYCFDIPYRHMDRLGDIKHVWELNRLQYLPPIAALTLAGQREDAETYCLGQIDAWIEANPPFLGVHWVSGIELSLRVVSLLLTITFLGSDKIPLPLTRKLRSAFFAHGLWLSRFPSRFSSANNHLIAEAAGLYVLGTLMPDLPGASAWENYGYATLVEEVERQILDDGVGAEQSPTYTAFTLEWYLLAAVLGERTGRPFPDVVMARLAAAAKHLRWMTDEAGHQPRIGDDDEGRVMISRPGGDADYVSSVLGCVASLVDAKDSAPPRCSPHLRHLVLGDPLVESTGSEGAEFFDEGGYSVFRHKLSGRNALIAFDHGPLGYLSIAAHGHADALSIWFHVDGVPVLIDAGTYLYHAGGSWRDHFRGTKAHNTLTLDDQDQSRISGPFNWSHKARAQRTPMKKTSRGLCAVAAHDGYQRRFGVKHQRSVMLAVPDGYVIEDTLIGRLKKADTEAAIRYLISPELTIVRLAENKVRLEKRGGPLVEVEMVQQQGGGERPSYRAAPLTTEEAWMSPRFGEKERASVLVCRAPANELGKHPLCTRVRVLPKGTAL